MHSFVPGQRLALLAPALAVTFALIDPLAAAAQTESAATDGVGVARISVIAGNVSLQRGDSSDALSAAINAPVLGGDYVSTGDAARTEIQFDGASQLRLGADTQLRFTHLDTADRAVQLAQGTVELRLLRDTDGASEIDTPSISIKPHARGAYRVSVTPDGQTLVTVRSGQAEIDTPQGAQDLGPGSTLVAHGAATDPSIQTVAAVGSDAFDSFNADRDGLYERAQSQTAFVNSDISGIADLPSYGHWVTDGSYGNVWVPASVAPNWAPYRDGRWVWEDGYGWTWVAAEPWGWAPYHYGSWYHSPNYGWCWYPPQPHIYTPWRPALVAFFGFGAGAGLSIGFGGGEGFNNIGWVPLAPHEAYHPWWGNRYGYGGNTTIVNNVTNITNVTNVTNVNVYRNVRYNAVSSVTSQRFLQGNFTRNAQVGAGDLQHARVFHSALPVVPTASNLRFTNATAHPAVAVHPELVQRSFAGNGDVVRRTSFTDQRIVLANVTHAPITPLNFRDARTTPLIRQPATAPQALAPGSGTTQRGYSPAVRRPNDVRVNPAPAAASLHPAVTGTTARPAYARPVPGTNASDPWARFNASRSITTEPRRPATAPVNGAYRQPAISPNRVQTIDGSTYVPANGTPIRRPAPGATYHAPAADRSFSQTTTNRDPATGVTSRAPIPSGANRQPETRNTYRQPGTQRIYQETTAGASPPARKLEHAAPSEPAYRAPAEHATVVHPAPAEHAKAEPPAPKPEPHTEHPPRERR